MGGGVRIEHLQPASAAASGRGKAENVSIKVFALDDIEWWAGESLEACLAAARDQCGDECYREAWCQHEVSEAGMHRLIFLDEDGSKRTFAEELQRRVDAGEQFPCLFAAEDW